MMRWVGRPVMWLVVGAAAICLGLVGLALALHGMAGLFRSIGTSSGPPCYAHVQGFRLPPGGHWC
jgi:hypothetical protein